MSISEIGNFHRSQVETDAITPAEEGCCLDFIPKAVCNALSAVGQFFLRLGSDCNLFGRAYCSSFGSGPTDIEKKRQGLEQLRRSLSDLIDGLTDETLSSEILRDSRFYATFDRLPEDCKFLLNFSAADMILENTRDSLCYYLTSVERAIGFQDLTEKVLSIFCCCCWDEEVVEAENIDFDESEEGSDVDDAHEREGGTTTRDDPAAAARARVRADAERQAADARAAQDRAAHADRTRAAAALAARGRVDVPHNAANRSLLPPDYTEDINFRPMDSNRFNRLTAAAKTNYLNGLTPGKQILVLRDIFTQGRNPPRIPDGFECVITLEIMAYPVTVHGHAFEASAILETFKTGNTDRDVNYTAPDPALCPLDRHPLPVTRRVIGSAVRQVEHAHVHGADGEDEDAEPVEFRVHAYEITDVSRAVVPDVALQTRILTWLKQQAGIPGVPAAPVTTAAGPVRGGIVAGRANNPQYAEEIRRLRDIAFPIDGDEEAPENMVCGISKEILDDPVVDTCPVPHNYNKEEIVLFRNQFRDECPLTNNPFPPNAPLRDNPQLQANILAFLRQRTARP